ncbi:MAG: homoserine kinase [Flavobacteriaceae bacterium]|nr:homoserine kinase [Bacteroidia bacterium]NNK88561.1 homoserine kinase [Flavobacteriaceae bacterium]
MNDQIKIFSPATVANVACGFDVLGFCLDKIGDGMTIKKVKEPGIRITKIHGCELPYEPEKNVAGVSALAMLEALKPGCGFEIEMHKGIKPGSGIGSSAASAAGSVFGMNELLGRPLNKTELTKFAMKGEALASQSEHADNLAPAIFGGFTLVRNVNPLDIVRVPTPHDLYATILFPQIEVKTAEARAILPKQVPLKKAIQQWANVGSLVHALHTSDYNLLRRSLKDVIIEPYRKQLIPEYDRIKTLAREAGALGCSISGSGPSVFALCKGKHAAERVRERFETVYAGSDIDFQTLVSSINTEGIRIL